MSKPVSNNSLDAMKDADRHAAGDTDSHNPAHPAATPVHDHTKPAGDLRDDVDRKDSRKAFRGEATRGH
jgi:hypothetical protein